MFITTKPLADSIAVYCMQQGVIMIEPATIPLPILLHSVADPIAERVFDDVRLSEAVRLFGPVCMPIKQIFVPSSDGLRLELGRFFGSEAHDARWLATQMTADLSEFLEQEGRDPFAERAATLAKSGTYA